MSTSYLSRADLLVVQDRQTADVTLKSGTIRVCEPSPLVAERLAALSGKSEALVELFQACVIGEKFEPMFETAEEARAFVGRIGIGGAKQLEDAISALLPKREKKDGEAVPNA